MERIFDSFSQGDESITRKFGGAGLGLAISKKLASAMGGVIHLESQVGMGSTFTAEIPVIQSEMVPEVKTGLAPRGGISLEESTLKILVVDDDSVNRLLMEKIIRLKGWQVFSAPDGASALLWLSNNDVDIILMDIQLPDISGLQLAEKIHSLPNKQNAMVPIIAVTAFVEEETRIECLQAGMNDFLAKPVMIEELYRMIDQWTDEGR